MNLLPQTLLAVAMGGALGAIARYSMSVWALQRFPGQQLPLATLTVNAIGALAIGILYVIIVERGVVDPRWQPLLMVGFLGSLTTFSTFSIELVNYLHRGEGWLALGYAALSVLLCLALTAAGIAATRAYF